MKALTLLTAAALTLLSVASGWAKPRHRPQLLPKARASGGTGHCVGPLFWQGFLLLEVKQISAGHSEMSAFEPKANIPELIELH